MDNYKIITTIKGKKYTLDKVGQPAPIFNETIDKNMTRDYILRSYKDIIIDKNDVEEIKYYKGRKIIKHYKYPNNWNSQDELMKQLLNC